MKRLLTIAICLAMLITMVSCGSKKIEDKDQTTDTTYDISKINPALKGPTFIDGLEYDYDNLSEFISLPKHTGIKLDVQLTEVTEQDVDNILRQALISQGSSTDVTDGAKAGDTVTYTSTATRDDTNSPLESGASRTITIGDSIYLDGFTENFIGAKVGDEVSFSYTFPSDYPQEDLVGVSATYNCKITSVVFITLPDFTDEWVVSQNIDNVKTTDDYRDYLKLGLEETAKENNGQVLRDAMEDILTSGAEVIELPQKEYNYYVDYCENSAQSYAQANGVSKETYITQTYGSTSEFDSYCQSYAQSKETKDLIMWSIIRETGVEIDIEEYANQIEFGFNKYGSSYGINTISEFEEAFSGDVTMALLYSSALDQLVSTCQY